jgi:ribosomal protein S27AE
VTPDVRRAYDEATVILLRATSTTAALDRAAHDEAGGVPAYDAPGQLRWDHRVCPWCGIGFVATHVNQRYCRRKCSSRAAVAAFDERRGRRTVPRRRAAILATVDARREVA